MSAKTERVQVADRFRVLAALSLARQAGGMGAVQAAELAPLLEGEASAAQPLGSIEEILEAGQVATATFDGRR
jgi:hypothetical protein